MLRHAAFAAVLVAGSLLMGMSGYVYLEHITWTDAFVDASMLLGGMGSVAGAMRSTPVSFFS